MWPLAHAQLGLEGVAIGDAAAQLVGGSPCLRAHLLAERPLLAGGERVRDSGQRGDPVDDLQGVAGPAPQRPPHPEGRPLPEQLSLVEGVHHEIHERNPARAGVVEAELPEHGPLDRHGGVALDEAHHLAAHPIGERPAARHHPRVEVQVGDDAPVGKSHGSFLRRGGCAGNPATGLAPSIRERSCHRPPPRRRRRRQRPGRERPREPRSSGGPPQSRRTPAGPPLPRPRDGGAP